MKMNGFYQTIGKGLAKPVYIMREGCTFQIYGRTRSNKLAKIDLDKIHFQDVIKLLNKLPTNWGKPIQTGDISFTIKKLKTYKERYGLSE